MSDSEFRRNSNIAALNLKFGAYCCLLYARPPSSWNRVAIMRNLPSTATGRLEPAGAQFPPYLSFLPPSSFDHHRPFWSLSVVPLELGADLLYIQHMCTWIAVGAKCAATGNAHCPSDLTILPQSSETHDWLKFYCVCISITCRNHHSFLDG